MKFLLHTIFYKNAIVKEKVKNLNKNKIKSHAEAPSLAPPPSLVNLRAHLIDWLNTENFMWDRSWWDCYKIVCELSKVICHVIVIVMLFLYSLGLFHWESWITNWVRWGQTCQLGRGLVIYICLNVYAKTIETLQAISTWSCATDSVKNVVIRITYSGFLKPIVTFISVNTICKFFITFTYSRQP